MQALLIAFGIALIGLKLAGIISLGWVWVLAPLWVPVFLFALFVVVVMTTALILK